MNSPRPSGAERAAEAARELGVDYTAQVKDAGRSAWEKMRAHQSSAAP
ncbi:hypothetical protein [Streptomyces sp. NPDC001635]